MTVLYTTRQAAKFMQNSPKTLERMRVEGNGPKFIKTGRMVRYRKADLEEWLDNNTFQSTSEYKLKEVT